MVFGLLAVLLVPLGVPSLSEGKKVKGFCFVICEELFMSDQK